MFHSTEGQIFTATKDEKQHLTVKGLSLFFCHVQMFVYSQRLYWWLLCKYGFGSFMAPFSLYPYSTRHCYFFFLPTVKTGKRSNFFFIFAFSVSYQHVRWVWKYWESKYLILSRPQGFVSCIVKNAKLDLFYLLFHPLKSKCLVWDDNKWR